MIFLVSTKYCGTANMLMEIFSQRNISAFRFNLDLFDSYHFEWNDDEFEIYDPENRCCKSSNITAIAFYKGILHDWTTFEKEEHNLERAWLNSWLNRLYDCIMCYGKEHNLVRLWYPHGFGYSKTYQMKIAKKFFDVPSFKLHWGKTLSSQNVIAKPLTQRPLSNNEMIYAKIVDRSNLDPSWPWFTQQIAKGNRDATVLYINGKVHCFQFATERNELTDWRITQGTERNQWIPWNVTKEFENKICQYMESLSLKYGRLDFIIGDGEPQFLEVNPEGQFGWLDDENLTLHEEVVDAILNPSSTIQI